MKADLNTLWTFFDNSSSQFIIPVFQRNYQWSKDNVDQLLSDFDEVLSRRAKTHFIGNVIYKIHTTQDNVMEKTLIDGQQRITTLFLLFNALKFKCQEINDISNENKLNDIFLENRYITGKFKLKLKPSVDNNDTYVQICEKQLEMDDIRKLMHNNLYINYHIIKRWVAARQLDYGMDRLISLTNNITLVYIKIDEDDDSQCQKIFESINSTGVSLTNSDLIRNFLLMDMHNDEQEKFYKEKWLVFEDALRESNIKNHDIFYRTFLQLKYKDIVDRNRIYKKFKDYAHERNNGEVCTEMTRYLSLYNEIYNSNIKEIGNPFLYFSLDPVNNTLQSTLLMFILDNFKKGKIEKTDFQKTVKLITSYSLRRKLEDLDTSSITRFLTPLIANIDLNREIYSQLYTMMVEDTKGKQTYAPSDASIRARMMDINFYSLSICKSILWILENNKNEAILDYDTLSVEHIIPQHDNQNHYWSKRVGGNDDEYVKTVNLLGNLTLVTQKDNSRMANSDWNTKKEFLMATKHIRLNESIIKIDDFNRDEIIKRQNTLLDKIFEIISL